MLEILGSINCKQLKSLQPSILSVKLADADNDHGRCTSTNTYKTEETAAFKSLDDFNVDVRISMTEKPHFNLEITYL